MAWAFLIAALTGWYTVAHMFSQYLDFRRTEREKRDIVRMADHLEAKLKAMDDLKAQMQGLILKNGFGR